MASDTLLGLRPQPTSSIALFPAQCKSLGQLAAGTLAERILHKKGLDSDALDQPTIWHAQNTQSRSHFRSETNHTQEHSPRRRRTPDPDVPSDPQPDQRSA